MTADEHSADVAPLTDDEREALWAVWESGVEDDAEFAGLFFAVVAVIRAEAVAAARADERERCAQDVEGPGYGTAAIRLRHLAATREADRG